MNQELENIPYQLCDSPIKSGVVLGNAFQDYHEKHPDITLGVLFQSDGEQEVPRTFMMRQRTKDGTTEETVLTPSDVVGICNEVGVWYRPRTDREVMVLPYVCDLEPQEIAKYYEVGISAECLTAILSVAEYVPNLTKEYAGCNSLVSVGRAICPYLLVGVGILTALYLIVKKYSSGVLHGKQ